MTNEMKIIYSVIAPVILLSGLAFFVLSDKYIQKGKKTAISVSTVLIITLIAQDLVDYYVSFIKKNPTLRLFNSTYGYIIIPFLIVLFHYFVGGKRKYWPAWCLAGVNTAIYVFSLIMFLISDKVITFGFTSNNVFKRGSLGYTSHIISVLLLLNLFCMTIKKFGKRKKYLFIPVFCFLLLFGAMMNDVIVRESELLPVSYLSYAIVICCVLFYLWMHIQLLEEYEESVAAQQKAKLMVSQIQPHFLFNTITTFKVLCKRDPDQAADLADKFGKYLRNNLDSINNPNLIPLTKEIEHTKLYADIEMVRFENVRVEFDIGNADFFLPALTIQPIVENAIRHGVRARDEGIVRITTRTADDFHEIVIGDNGVGFDFDEKNEEDGKHIGIRNVRERLSKLCGGTMTVESEMDKGTTVTIRIPAKEMN